MITIAAGSGTGKSTICREFAYHFLRNGLKVGYLALEESVQRTLMGLVGIDMNIPLHLAAKESLNQDELKSLPRGVENTTQRSDAVYKTAFARWV